MTIYNKYEYEKVNDRKVIERCKCIYGNGKRMDTTRLLIREGPWWFGEVVENAPPLDEEWTVPATPKSAYWYCPTNHPLVVKNIRFGFREKDFKSLSERRKPLVAAFIWERKWDSSIGIGVYDIEMIFEYLHSDIQYWIMKELGSPFNQYLNGRYTNFLPAHRLKWLDEKLGRPSGYKVRPEANWRV